MWVTYLRANESYGFADFIYIYIYSTIVQASVANLAPMNYLTAASPMSHDKSRLQLVTDNYVV